MKKVLSVGVMVAALAALLLGGRELARYVPGAVEWVQRLGPWGPIAFITLYTVGTVALVPAVWLTLAAGALFGVARGFVIDSIAAVLGSCAAFAVSRYFARDWVAARLRRGAAFDRIDRAIAAQGFRVVLLLRLSPLIPFNVLNYALGLTQVRFSHYVLASVGMMPVTLFYVYSGKVIGDVAAIASGTAVPKSAAYYAVVVAGLCATLAVTILLTRIASRALRETDPDRAA